MCGSLTPAMKLAWVQAGITRREIDNGYVLLDNGEPLLPKVKAMTRDADAEECATDVFRSCMFNPSFGSYDRCRSQEDAIENDVMAYIQSAFPAAFARARDRDSKLRDIRMRDFKSRRGAEKGRLDAEEE